MTASDVALPHGSAQGAKGSPWARVRTRARLRVTQRDVKAWKIASRLATKTTQTVREDARNHWALTAEPPTLTEWFTSIRTSDISVVPGRSPVLLWAWRIDNWITGSMFAAASVLWFTGAAGIRWCACHPMRRWAFITCSGAIVALWLH
jgi:hypothetical protein